MNPRNTVLLALVVAALAAFLWFYEIGREEERARAEEAEKRIFGDLEAEAIQAIELETSDGQTARLERGEAGWRLVEPVSFDADAFAADGLASALAELTSEAVFDEPEPLEEYGLDEEPAVRFQVGDAWRDLRIGDKTPVGGNTYVTSGDGSRVYAVSSYRLNAMDKSVQDLRDARVLVFDREGVRRLRASWPGGGVALERGEQGWRVTSPVEARADDDTVDALLSTLQFLRAEGFDDEPPPDAQLGLDAPAFAVELELEEGVEPIRLAIGSHTQDAQRPVRGRAADVVYRIGESRLEDFPRRVADYRFKRLAEFDDSEARRFELEFREGGATGRVTGKRGDAGWETTPLPMAPGKAGRLLTELASLEAQDIAAESLGETELAGLGLSPPRVRVRVFGESGGGEEVATLADVELGEASAERGIPARKVGEPVVYWLPFALGEHLPLSQEAFDNRFVSAAEPEADESEGVEPAADEPEAGGPEAAADAPGPDPAAGGSAP